MCFVYVPPLSYSPLFVLGLLNSNYLEDVINKNHPTTSSLNIGKLPFRRLENLEEPENVTTELPMANDPVRAYYVVIQCTRKLIDLRNALTQAIEHEERIRLGLSDMALDRLSADQRMDRDLFFQEPTEPDHLDAHNTTKQARKVWQEQSESLYTVLNEAVCIYYNGDRLSDAI